MSKFSTRVQIALPVFNGENYLTEAIESVLHQTYEEFQLLVFDNSSTDGTESIGRKYAALDRRVQYTRREKNLGAGPNFNLAFEDSSAEYFKWLAHDDLLMPRYLESAVHALDEDRDAMLFQSATRFVDADGNTIGATESVCPDLMNPSVSKRFAAHLSSRGVWAIFGVVRSKQLALTRRFQSYQYADWLLLGEMTLAGRIIACEEPLWLNRHHGDQYYRKAALQASGVSSWWNTNTTRDPRFHQWKHFVGYVQAIQLLVPDRTERLRCYYHFMLSLGRRRHAARLAVGLIGAIDPRVGTAMKELFRERIYRRRFPTLGSVGTQG